MTGKKSGEILQGGLSSIKNAATSLTKKLDEIKEVISVNTTPVKTNSLDRNQHLGVSEDDLHHYQHNLSQTEDSLARSRRASDLDLWGRLSESRKSSYNNLVPLGEAGYADGPMRKYPSLPEGMYGDVASEEEESRGLPTDTEEADVEIDMTSGSQCHNCSLLLYDEEIMAGWSAEDSNLNTTCPECKKLTVPFLTVHVKYRCDSVAAADRDPLAPTEETPPQPRIEPHKVPYLNPLVLRKELENILVQEGHVVLARPQFVTEHPIIYWNLVWFLERADINTHLPGLCAAVGEDVDKETTDVLETEDPLSSGSRQKKVVVRCLWDNVELHSSEVGTPMYVLWHQRPQTSPLVNALVTDQTSLNKTVIQQVISALRCSDMSTPIKRLANERHKMSKNGVGVDKSHSIYWDILFLALTAIGRDNIDMAFFHKEYAAVFEKLTDRERAFYRVRDYPPTVTTICCRGYFKPLLLP